jgi:septal ring factor EnvC (AmiA/AmiB activator)
MQKSVILYMKKSTQVFAQSGYMREIKALKTMYKNHSNMLDIVAQSLNELDQKINDQVEKNNMLEGEINALKFDNKMLEQKIRVFVEKNNMF